VNWLAIIIAAIANMVIGTLWYGTWAFGKSWMKLSGHTMGEGLQAGPLYALTAVAAVVQAITMAWFVSQTGASRTTPAPLRDHRRLLGRRGDRAGRDHRIPGGLTLKIGLTGGAPLWRSARPLSPSQRRGHPPRAGARGWDSRASRHRAVGARAAVRVPLRAGPHR
jgi:hypothetical protein